MGELDISEETDLCDNDTTRRSVCNMTCEINFDSNRFPQRIAEYVCLNAGDDFSNKCGFPKMSQYMCMQVWSDMTVFRAHSCNDMTEYRSEMFTYRSGCICGYAPSRYS